MKAPLHLIATQLDDPRDVLILRSLSEDLYRTVDIPKSLFILGTEEAELFLQRHPDHVEELTVVCREDDRGFSKVLPCIGKNLRSLDIRYQGELSIAFLEFLPRLEHLSVSARTLTTFPSLPKPPWGEHFLLQTLRIITTDDIVLPRDFASMYPMLQHLYIQCRNLGCGRDCSLPRSIRHLSVRASVIGSNVWDSALHGLEQLETCTIDGGCLYGVPRALAECPRLQRLTMCHGALDGTRGGHMAIVDTGLYMLGGTRYLNLSGNRNLCATDLVDIAHLQDLECLDVRGCNLSRQRYALLESDSLTTLHISSLPPLPWVIHFQNLEDVYIHPPDSTPRLQSMVTKMIHQKRDEDDSNYSDFRTISIPETRDHANFRLHIHPSIQFDLQSIVLLAKYMDSYSV